MFETSRPQQTTRGRLLFLELLPASLALHAIVIGGIGLNTIWKVQFPQQSPKLYLAFQIAEPPPPPPPPPPPAPPRPQVAQQPVQQPREIVAPNVIPEEIPVVVDEPPPPPVESPAAVEGGVDGGMEGGEVGGEMGGVLGGVITDLPQPPKPDDGRVHIERDAPLRLPILSQVYPMYPRQAMLRGWEDRLVVRYVIGTDGRVKEVTIIDPPQRPLFEKPTVRAIKSWRFRPLVKNGEKVEVVHELTVNYRFVARGG